MHVYKYINTYMHTYTHTHTYIRKHTHTHAYAYVYMYIHIYTYMSMYTYVYTYVWNTNVFKSSATRWCWIFVKDVFKTFTHSCTCPTPWSARCHARNCFASHSIYFTSHKYTHKSIKTLWPCPLTQPPPHHVSSSLMISQKCTLKRTLASPPPNTKTRGDEWNTSSWHTHTQHTYTHTHTHTHTAELLQGSTPWGNTVY